jgi:hypothetical protein
LLDYDEIEWRIASKADIDPAWSLLQAIIATRLIERKEGFYSDEIIRRLLAIEMRWDKPERFQRLCQYAEDLYRAARESPNPGNPILLVIERTYQQLQRNMIDRNPPKDQIIRSLRTMLSEYVDRAESPIYRQERLQDLKQVLADDWEWQYLVTDLLGPEAIQNILPPTMPSLSPDMGGNAS